MTSQPVISEKKNIKMTSQLVISELLFFSFLFVPLTLNLKNNSRKSTAFVIEKSLPYVLYMYMACFIYMYVHAFLDLCLKKVEMTRILIMWCMKHKEV